MDPALNVTSTSAILGQTLALIRKENGFTQEEMAKSIGVSLSSWSRIEKGEADISVNDLRRAANYLGVRTTDIILAAEAGESDARAKGVKIIDGAVSSIALASTLTGGIAGIATLGSVIPVVGPLLGGLVGSAIGAALAKSNRKK